MLTIEKAVCGYRRGGKQPDKIVLDGLSLSLKKGRVVCLLGANGIGKTTLFQTIFGTLPLLGGRMLLNGRNLSDYSRRETARLIGYVPQSHTPPFPFTVLDVVLMGRTAYLPVSASPSSADTEIALSMLERMGIAELAGRSYTEISGGERQMVLIARALAQQPEFLIMDEPTASLDFGNQVAVLQNIRTLVQSGIGVLFSSHNPEQAFLLDADVAVIKDKAHFALGPAKEMITERLIREIYGAESAILTVRHEKGSGTAVIPFIL